MFYSPRGLNQFENNALDNITAQKLLEILVSGKSLSPFFTKTGIQKIGIAPFNHFTECIVRMISKDVDIVAIADKNHKKFPQGYKSIPVVPYDELAVMETDAVIITSSIYQNDIIDTLMSFSFPLERIVGLNTIVFGLERMK